MTPEEDQLTIDQAYNQPSVIATPIEAVIARKMVLRAWWVGPIIVGAAWAIRGSGGAWAAAIGVVIVAVNFLVAGELFVPSCRGVYEGLSCGRLARVL